MEDIMTNHLFHTYAPPDLNFTHGRGAVLFADTGREYLDFISGIAVNALGHAHPALVDALKAQGEKLWHLSNMFKVPGQQELAARYCEATFADEVFFTNSGAEAMECALKTARRYHFVNKSPERINIVTFTGAFHGRTYGAINAGGNPKYLEGFGPSMPGFQQVGFGDHDALYAAVDETTAAVLLEPVQGEGGVRTIPDQCLTGVRKLCRERGALLIYDEVQSGAGRTGKLFAHEWAEDAAPDIMAIAKGIGGGFPMGACLATKEAAKGMTPGTHGTTFGGNALAMAVGAAAFGELTKPGFMETVQERAATLKAGLERLAAGRNAPVIAEVRGKGLLLGIKVNIPNVKVRDAARERGLLVGVAGENVVRMAPPLIISDDQANAALEILDAALAEVATSEESLAEPRK